MKVKYDSKPLSFNLVVVDVVQDRVRRSRFEFEISCGIRRHLGPVSMLSYHHLHTQCLFKLIVSVLSHFNNKHEKF